MPNDYAGDPLILNTAHATDVVVQGGKFIYAINWVGGGANNAAELRVKSSARVFWAASSPSVGNDLFEILRIVTPGDLILAVLGTGTLYVYLGPER